MQITRIRFGSIPPFSEPIDLNIDGRVNVFIGPNASGKSTLLLALGVLFIWRGVDSTERMYRGLAPFLLSIGEADDGTETEQRLEDRILWVRPDREITSREDIPNLVEEIPPPRVYIGPLRELLPSISQQTDVNAFGTDIDEILGDTFSGTRTVLAYHLLLGERENKQVNPAVRRAAELADSCSKRICNELIADSKPHQYVPSGYTGISEPERELDADTDKLPYLMGINTTDIRDFSSLSHRDRPDNLFGEPEDSLPIQLGHLSAGTQGTLLWIRWLALQMVHHHKYEEGWEAKPAYLFIDEIENHLHPTWQRRVIPALLEHFPGLQIFATTHSPFVVAGLKKGQVHILKRDGNGVVTASSNEQDVVGWTMDEILRGMMGVDDPTDEDTARAAAELRQLRSGEPKTDEEEEELRQQRIQELRSVVDRDLLAGGPVAAQRELFEQNLADILEEHRKAQGLNQD